MSRYSNPLVLLLLLTLSVASSHAAVFYVLNQCPYTVWAAASPGGGLRLDPGQKWTFSMPAGTSMARIWGRTNCQFGPDGRGHCETGDCGGLLRCQGWGNPPNTLAEYRLNGVGNQDFYDISLVDGFNIPMEFSPTTGRCKDIRCFVDINGQCPGELRSPGGCHNPCTVYKTNEYCCTRGQGTCGPTGFSRFFKSRCPDAYSYPQDDPTSTFTCPSGVNYKVLFCPRGGSNGGDGLEGGGDVALGMVGDRGLVSE